MIKPFDFILPSNIIYGVGVAKRLKDEIEKISPKTAMIVTDKNLVEAKVVDRIFEYIPCKYIVYDDIEPNPKDYNIDNAAKVATQNNVDLLIAFGGGSSIDAAKGIAIVAKSGESIINYADRNKEINDTLPLITIPTTAGTGSEVTFSSVITNTDSKFKFTVKSKKIAPCVAIVDPQLTVSMPKSITASTGMDALTHAIEGYTAICSEPIAECLGLYAIEYIYKSIKRAYDTPNDMDARDDMMMGSLLAGLSFSHSDVASVHCMAESLGSLYDLPHGMCNSIILPHVMDYSLDFCIEKYARIARVMGISEKDDKTAAKLGIKKIKDISKSIDLPKLSQLNIRDEDIEKLARMSFVNGSNDSNPRKMTEEDYICVFKNALEE